jgi:NAD(P)H-flavin reductase
MNAHLAPVLHGGRVARAWDESTVHRGLTIVADVPSAAAPGQYVKLVAGVGVEGFFALSSGPDEGVELLIRRGGALADALGELRAGDELRVTAPMGLGYPVREHVGRDLVLLAAGSGIAPLRGVVRWILADRARYGRVRIYYGQRHPEELAYRSEAPEWGAAGIELTSVVSDPTETWDGARGHVQDVFGREAGELARSVIYVCGMKEMIDGVYDVVDGLGVDRTRVYLNY